MTVKQSTGERRFRRVSLRAGIVSDGQTEQRRATFPSLFLYEPESSVTDKQSTGERRFRRVSLRAGNVSDGQTEHRRAAGGNPLILFWFVSRFCRYSLPAGNVSDGQTEHRRAAGGNPLILFWFGSMVSRFCRYSFRAGSGRDGQMKHRGLAARRLSILSADCFGLFLGDEPGWLNSPRIMELPLHARLFTFPNCPSRPFPAR